MPKCNSFVIGAAMAMSAALPIDSKMTQQAGEALLAARSASIGRAACK
jgi:type IV secretory pathway TrbL component